MIGLERRGNGDDIFTIAETQASACQIETAPASFRVREASIVLDYLMYHALMRQAKGNELLREGGPDRQQAAMRLFDTAMTQFETAGEIMGHLKEIDRDDLINPYTGHVIQEFLRNEEAVA